MENAIWLLAALGIGAWAWRDAMRGRERAIAVCRAACERHTVQLLDETVVLVLARPVWTRAGPRVRRVYEFDVSADGVSRDSGSVALVGTRLEGIYLPGLWEGWGERGSEH